MTWAFLHKATVDKTPRNADGKPLQRVEGTRNMEGPSRIVRGAPILLRIESVSAVLPDRERDDGAWASLVQRDDGTGPIQVYESAVEVREAFRASNQ